MIEENPILPCRPGQDFRVRRPGQACTLNAQKIEIWQSQEKSSQYATIDVLVGSQPQHRNSQPRA